MTESEDGFMKVKKKNSSSVKKKPLRSIESKIKEFKLTAEFISRMRWVLFVIAFLLLFLAFQAGDDWFVRKFANYDWARSIGF